MSQSSEADLQDSFRKRSGRLWATPAHLIKHCGWQTHPVPLEPAPCLRNGCSSPHIPPRIELTSKRRRIFHSLAPPFITSQARRYAMAILNLDLNAALASCAPPSLSDFDIDATLETPVSHYYDVPPSVLSLVQSIEDALQEGNLPVVKRKLAELRRLAQGHGNICTGRALLLAIEHQHQDMVACLLSGGVDTSYYEVKKATSMKNTTILELLFEKAWRINTALGWDDPPALA